MSGQVPVDPNTGAIQPLAPPPQPAPQPEATKPVKGPKK